YQFSALGSGPSKAEFGNGSGQDMINFVEGIVHFKGILKDSLDLPPEGSPFILGNILKILSSIENNPTGGLDEAQQQAGQGCLAAPALPSYGNNGGMILSNC
ncbi:unnamed protein product, partial [marine sediment metagenome]